MGTGRPWHAQRDCADGVVQAKGRFARLSTWPREESNLRTRIRSPPLYPLSYGARR